MLPYRRPRPLSHTFLLLQFSSHHPCLFLVCTNGFVVAIAGGLSDTTSTPATMAPIQQSTSLGLHPATINVMPIITSMTTNVANDVIVGTECSICLSLSEDEGKVKVLPVCNHAYHSECIDKWPSTQSSCPVCRASLRPKSNEDLQKTPKNKKAVTNNFFAVFEEYIYISHF
ncbi:hypothetical protein D5086_018095 [Populus alba]|uniref:Uncharacterized protein n=2 Tax=Populus alba TaxID=43335 RepID=A0ACC4BPF4_POPAL|nr:hypothetical protein D5086_0000168880 [Populus alba]